MTNSSDKRKKKPTRYVYKWIGHIEVYFNDDERTRVIQYCNERTFDIEDSITRITQAKIGVKFTYSETNDSYRITLQPKDKDHYLNGYTIGFSHVDLNRLLQVTLYIVYEMMENQQIELPEKRSTNEW